MKVITLLTAGHIGGIETLCMDYAVHSRHDNLMLILWGDGHVDELMIERGIRVMNLHASRRNVPETVKKVMQVIRDEKADVLIAQHEAAMSHLCLMRAKKLFPRIHTIAYAQLNAVDMIRADEKRRLWLRKAVLGTSLKKADDVVAISQSVKQSLLDVLDVPEEKISIIYNGTDLAVFPYVTRDHASDVLELIYTGRLIPEKGVQITLKALSEVSDRLRFHFRIAGDGPYADELKRLTDELGVSDVVEFLGSRSDVPELLKMADVFVHMPVWAEGFGISVTEAMSSGCMCICANNGAMPELITDGRDGYLVGREDHAALARRLDAICLMSAEEKEAIALAAHERAKEFSIERFVRDLDDLAERVVVK